MKKVYLITIVCSLLMIALFGMKYYMDTLQTTSDRAVKVGCIYVGDASTPYTNNFIKAQNEIEQIYGKKVITIAKENIPEGQETVALEELVEEKCDLIIATSYGYQSAVKEFAKNYPDIEFCQATGDLANAEPVLKNYHTFMGHIYEGRYVTGVVAGMKLEELIDAGKLDAKDAVIGYVAAFPYAEVISGYTAFFLGVRSVVPEATMKVKYTNTWAEYELEKKVANELIDEGCVLISQHSDTTGPATACEEARENGPMFHVGYNQSMIDVAPTTSLISSRINWEPYYEMAVKAVLDKTPIEKMFKHGVNGNDVGLGFDDGWVELLDLNESLVADGTALEVMKCIEKLNNHSISVFKGDYTGTDPFDPSDTYDLKEEFIENKSASAPSFHYVLDDVITVIE